MKTQRFWEFWGALLNRLVRLVLKKARNFYQIKFENGYSSSTLTSSSLEYTTHVNLTTEVINDVSRCSLKNDNQKLKMR
uniref:Uncharacterized protein n=1 Tax=Glossina brevipalpis TaxID=37001 RepID=A0A1A9WIJ8_9MUSC